MSSGSWSLKLCGDVNGASSKEDDGFFAAVYQKRPMRFRLHTKSASTGQVTTNTAALDALLQRVDELESAGGTSGGIEITTQVTGDDEVHTVGALDISDAVLTPVTFADAFSNGISHAYVASIFNVTAAGDCW